MNANFVVEVKPRPFRGEEKETIAGARSHIIIREGRIVEAADSLAYMRGWTFAQLRAWVDQKGPAASLLGPL
jgi:hypothetical protein